jgi:hypothetical protein
LSDYYILVGQTVVPCGLMEWAVWFEENPDARRVAYARVLDMVEVSTVFMGLDHSFERFRNPAAPPILFESMAFWPGRDGYEQERCSTWVEAEAMHARIVRHVASPTAVWEYLTRQLGEAIAAARRDAARLWRELQGRTPNSFDRMLEQMDRVIESRREQF